MEYKAPYREIQFLLNELFPLSSHVSNLSAFEGIGWEDVGPILEAAGEFAAKEIRPLMRSGDEQGVRLVDGQVKLPDGWVKAYKTYSENGWSLLEAPEEFGGTPLPSAVPMLLSEMLASANPCWGMLQGLSAAAIEVIHRYAPKPIAERFMPALCEGKWYGTMCLTEPHCGTDLGLVRTKAEPQGDLYTITGSKIFITAGDHDASENIIHLVLARLPDAPKGTKGISLFLVPKVWVEEDGSLSKLNGVQCSAVEHKMGIKASPTCVLNFEKAKGYLIGKPHAGLHAMFTMMNIARIGTGIQGYATGVASFQLALAYAKDRLQMRSLSGKKNPDGPADPIIVHPDVRRMLLTQKSLTEGCRALMIYGAHLVDQTKHGKSDDEKKKAEALLSLLTPIIKAFSTEVGVEATYHGVQILGGHGYISEHGVEQLARDARIAPIYEGTNAIQALDLLGRKVLMNQGETLKIFIQEILGFSETLGADQDLAPFADQLKISCQKWGEITPFIGGKALKNPDEMGAAAFDYMMFSGYVTLGYFWAKMAAVAKSQLSSGKDQSFYQAKLYTAQFYFQKILPRTRTLLETMKTGSECLMNMPEDQFDLDI